MNDFYKQEASDALADLGRIMDFAYANGFHEIGYNPIAILDSYIKSLETVSGVESGHANVDGSSKGLDLGVEVRNLTGSVSQHKPSSEASPVVDRIAGVTPGLTF